MISSMSLIDLITKACSAILGLTFGYTMFQSSLPEELRGPIKYYIRKLADFFNPYIHITFPEYTGDYTGDDRIGRSPAFTAIERYLNASSTNQAKNLSASMASDSEAIVLSMAKKEEVTDVYQGIKLCWTTQERESSANYPNLQHQQSSTAADHVPRFFRLTFHMRHRNTTTTKYLPHVIAEGKAIAFNERRRKLFTNKKTKEFEYLERKSMWNHVVFEHPATFDTLAMDPDKKQDIVNDLLRFAASKDYYAKIGKAWKRGYLLFGPPGTGKSTMIAAMANLLNYDIYDVELTVVKDNTELRKLLIDTSNKSIIVIEDIDCSLDMTGQRRDNKDGEIEKLKAKIKKMEEDGYYGGDEKKEKLTLSGLLNFIDGIWSACGGERIIVFTTNYVDKLDPALIRRGRMDKHVEMSYCGFEAFKVLAKNYLDIEDHELFGTVRRMLEETEMTPADVAENMMPTLGGEEDVESCLKRLINALEEAKEQARIKAQEKLANEEAEKKKKQNCDHRLQGVWLKKMFKS